MSKVFRTTPEYITVTDVVLTGDIYTGIVSSETVRTSIVGRSLIQGDEVFFTKKIEFSTKKDTPSFVTLVHKDDIVATSIATV